MYIRVNLNMKKPTLCCFTCIALIELNFTVAFLLIKKILDGWFVGNTVCTPSPFLLRGGGCWASYQIYKKRGLIESEFLEGVTGKEGVTFFRVVSVFT